MADAHLQEVQKLYNESVQADTEAMHKDPDVMDASRAVEAARRALNLDRHNPERQQHLRDCEKNYLSATNSFFHNAMLARLEAEAQEKKRKAQAQEAEAAEQRRRQLEMTPEKQEMLRRYRSVL